MKRFYGHLLLDPTAEGAGNGNGISATLENDATDLVLSRLGLSTDLAGERPAPEKPKAQSPKPKAAAEKPAESREEDEGTGEEKPEGEKPEDEIVEGEEKPEGEAEEVVAPEFSPEQQAWLDAQTEAHTTALTEAETKLTESSKRVEELEAELAGANTQPLAIANIDPLFLADSEADLVKADREMAAFEKWALQNWEGSEAVEAQGNIPARPAYTAAQVRERYAEIRERRSRLIPAARQALEQRGTFDTAAKERFPNLFNPKHPDYRVAEAVLKQAPGLKAIFPNIKIFIGDSLRGEQVRLAEEKAKATKTAATKAAVKVAPKTPVRSAPGTKTKVAAPAPKGDEINAKTFMERGGDRNALVSMLTESSLTNQ